ncbi:MAG TPA: hypothetical protein VI136_16495 [Verrucomicrobiae bacterium]
MRYAVACLLTLGILTLLRILKDSPIRSWKTVFLTGTPLALVVCYYLSCAFPPPPPPQPRAEKVDLNKAELERTVRHIEGVRWGQIDQGIILMDFAQEKSRAQLKEIALHVGVTAAHFMRTWETNRVMVIMTINGRNRYAVVYDTRAGIIDEPDL